MRAVRDTPSRLIWSSILFTILSYLALIGRDRFALIYIGSRIPASPLLLASFCGSVLSNAIGFGASSGKAVRDRVYGAIGLGSEQIDRVMVFNELGFGIGLVVFVTSNLILAGPYFASMLSISTFWLRMMAATFLLVILGIIATSLRRGNPVVVEGLSIVAPKPKVALFQFLLTQLEFVAATAALWFLLPSPNINFFGVAGLCAGAVGLGAIIRVPGGLGVFDAVVFLSLSRSVSPNALVAALLIYRAVYFFLPIMFAALSLATLELRCESNVLSSIAGERVLRSVDLLAPTFLSVLTFAVGIMLILSGMTPAVDWRLAMLQTVLPLRAVEISHLLATLAGVFLLFVARGLYHRLDGAWWLALLVALFNVGFSLAKGLAFGETTVILFLVFVLLATRRQFTRQAAFLGQPFTLSWFLTIAVVIAAATGIMLFAFRDVTYRREIWWQFEFDAQASRSLRALLGASILMLGISLRQLLRTASGRTARPSAEELARAALIIRQQERSEGLLALMGDKSFLFSRSGNAFLMYAKRGRSWVALFDPVGPRLEWLELVWRFVELADAHGGRAAFYQLHPDSLPLHLDAGLRIMKIGEEARIDLEHFSLQGPQRYGLRQVLKRAERDGLNIQILSKERGPHADKLICRISDSWLGERGGRERRFSVAAFEPGYIAAQSVAISCLKGEPVAFATLMMTDHETEATIGLMRYMHHAPPYVMEYLIASLALELKIRKFQILSLGMAPLAGLARTPLSSRWHRMAGLLWELGGPVYNFQGLRAFKNKFRPMWEPRYLAASGAIGPFISLADVAALASGAIRRSSRHDQIA